jgi:hypothetical protein
MESVVKKKKIKFNEVNNIPIVEAFPVLQIFP